MGKRGRHTRIIAALASLPLLGLGMIVVFEQRGMEYEPRLDDINKLRVIASTVALRRGKPMFDETGRLDFYAMLSREGLTVEEVADVCTSMRTGTGPTPAMIASGDYSMLPYERGKAPIHNGDKKPILWDREPDEDGNRLVARGYGAVASLTEDEFQQLLTEPDKTVSGTD